MNHASDLYGDPAPRRPIRTLLPMACDGVGPSFTCLSLSGGAHEAGFDTAVWANRLRDARPAFPLHLSLPGPLAYLPYRRLADVASKRIERAFLKAIKPGDIAYLWPSVSVKTHQVLRDRGHFIVLEGINTRMAKAKRILDDAYAAFGAPPAHTITQARIDEEEEKYALADTIFAPNANVEQALIGSALEGRFIPASYGVDTTKVPQVQPRRNEGALTFLFCGYACVRKGVHHLLDAWEQMGSHPHRLQIVGRIESVIAERYRDLLASDQVDVVGFVKDVHPYFAAADVFVLPSLEEGDPLVTYEAALHALPIVATPMGASRIGADAEAIRIVPPGDVTRLSEALQKLADDPDTREAMGQRARKIALDHDWRAAGARRAAQLMQRVAAG